LFRECDFAFVAVFHLLPLVYRMPGDGVALLLFSPLTQADPDRPLVIIVFVMTVTVVLLAFLVLFSGITPFSIR
jgi:hypothetical protein